MAFAPEVRHANVRSVGILSNLLGSLPDHAGSRSIAPLVTVRPARREEHGLCLKLILGSVTTPADDQQVVDFLRLAIQRQINLDNIWLAEAENKVAWAVLPLLSPGRSMLLLWPDGLNAALAPAARDLLDALARNFAERDVRLAQTLLDPGDTQGASVHRESGFQHIADLLYLQANVSVKAPAAVLAAGWKWVHYSPAVHHEFAQAIMATYERSLDCPALNGLRDMDDIMAGHQAAGEFDPRWWFLLRRPDGSSAGVLLLSKATHNPAAELVYVGLAPDARGQDLGDLLIRHALHQTAAAGLGRICLAVDANNAPALKLYFRYGFARIGCKLAMMRRLK